MTLKKSEKTKRKILEKTIETISNKGYAGTTTKEIANNAGVSEGTIFKYYGSKKVLLEEIVEQTLKEFSDYTLNEVIPEIIEETEKEEPRKLLQKLVRERAQFFRDHQSAIEVIIQETMINDSISEIFREEIWGEMERFSDQIFDEGKKYEQFKEVDNRLLRRVVFGSLFFQIIFEWMIGVNNNGEELSVIETEKTLDLLFHGILEENK